VSYERAQGWAIVLHRRDTGAPLGPLSGSGWVVRTVDRGALVRPYRGAQCRRGKVYRSRVVAEREASKANAIDGFLPAGTHLSAPNGARR